MLTKVTNIDSFDALLDKNEFFFFLKHSNTCPISAGAFEEFKKFHYERDIDGFYLIVQDHRELSNYISEKFDIKHESPQAFYFDKGEVKWHASHDKITLSKLASVED
ncbi:MULTISPECIES: bacillithiol system redox-active protein YtxJ [Salinicoccus]|uniref:Bacillithiol system protein YtxJ n=2 Tax=Salinicoccus TaxID=45669 RepID=A0A285UR84_9STAP|nr:MULTISPECIES: bacillithiol system redox-active protein YtxJ [Salinicoccus]MCD2138870.1 bacillithiol system redox-active protein YtxJ [Salinicoccus halitifaciens]SOC44384.1 bacillithiol system protein YtxJ [Salinicoccus kekensis]